MRFEINSKGWTQTSIKTFYVSGLFKEFNPIPSWIDFNKRHPSIGKQRQTCCCCGRRWEDLTGHVNLAVTQLGNRSICDDCYDELKKTVVNLKTKFRRGANDSNA